MDVLGLDIGGANLKAAHTSGAAAGVPFALWRHPERLADELRKLVAPMPPWQRVVVTMTGELCDCFESKSDGVAHILGAAMEVFGELDVWTTAGRFVGPAAACERWLETASANWLALATFAGRFAPTGPAILLDVGTTTIDLIPLFGGKPIPQGLTDRERLSSGELVYCGWRRTPLCAVYPGVAAEFFATMHDVCLVNGLVPEDANDRDTADGRPATVEAALRRIARMHCADLSEVSESEVRGVGARILTGFLNGIAAAFRKVEASALERRATVILSGSGAFLGALALQPPLNRTTVRLDHHLSPAASAAACGYAVATLRAEAG